MSRELRFVRVYPFSCEQVWAALTDSTAISEWLMPNDFKPEVGREFQFRNQPMGNWDGIVNCKVLKVDEPHELVYSWYNKQMNTELSIRLEPVPEGTRLTLVHSGFQGLFATLISIMMGNGWKRITAEYIPRVVEKMARGEALTGAQMCYSGRVKQGG